MKAIFFDFSNTKFSWRRSLKSYTKVQLIYSEFIRGKKIQLRNIKNTNKMYLNVGCGSHIYSEFVNLDYRWIPGIDLCWDIVKGIPIISESMKGIFSEHCLEHISFAQCQNVLKDFYRILKWGGIVRIVVPDAELYLDLYHQEKQGKYVIFPYAETDMTRGFTPMMAINRIFRNHGHQYAYDARTLKMMLEKEGFCDIRKEAYRRGKDQKLLIDCEDRKTESLYIEAMKSV